MIDYLKSDFYVLKKMKIVYILPIICLLMILLSNFLLTRLNFMAVGMGSLQSVATTQSNEDLGDQMVESFKTGFELGIDQQMQVEEEDYEVPTISDIFSGGALYEGTVAQLFQSQVSGLTVLMFIAVFAAFYFSNQVKGTFNKNILKTNNNRWISFISKTIVSLTYSFIFMLFAYLVCVFSAATMCKSFDLGFTADFVKYFAVELLLTFAMCMLTGMVAVLTNTAVGMIFAIVTGAGLLNLVTMLIDILVNNVILKNGDFATSHYIITGNMSALSIGADSGDFVRPIVVALIFFAVSFAATGFVNARRDIH